MYSSESRYGFSKKKHFVIEKFLLYRREALRLKGMSGNYHSIFDTYLACFLIFDENIMVRSSQIFNYKQITLPD